MNVELTVAEVVELSEAIRNATRALVIAPGPVAYEAYKRLQAAYTTAYKLYMVVEKQAVAVEITQPTREAA